MVDICNNITRIWFCAISNGIIVHSTDCVVLNQHNLLDVVKFTSWRNSTAPALVSIASIVIQLWNNKHLETKRPP